MGVRGSSGVRVGARVVPGAVPGARLGRAPRERDRGRAVWVGLLFACRGWGECVTLRVFLATAARWLAAESAGAPVWRFVVYPSSIRLAVTLFGPYHSLLRATGPCSLLLG